MNEDGTVGGSHQALFDLATRLDRRAFEPLVIFYEDNRFAQLLRDADIPVHVWTAPRAMERARRFRAAIPGKVHTAWKMRGAIVRRHRLLRSERIDIVHLNNNPSMGFDDWLPAARLARVPITCHSRGPYVRPTTAIGRWLSTRFEGYVAISRYIADDLVRHGMPAGRIHQIYDGIDLDRWHPVSPAERSRVRLEHGVPDDALLVILVGLIRSWKGQAVALEALGQLTPEHRRAVRLWIVGGVSADEMPYERGLRRQVAETGLEETVTFLGHRSDVRRLMAAADVVLHTSTVPEPFGLVVLEGLALGKTVVASQLGGPGEILQPGDGLLFDPGRPTDLAAILADLVRNPARRLLFGQRAALRGRAFDVRRTAEAVVALWTRVLGDP